jgi:hypothetical protein
MSRSELTQIESPAPTATWKPIRHSELIEQLDSALHAQGFHIWCEQFAVQHHDHRLFGVLDLNTTTDEFRAALGVRASNDKTFAIQLAVGLRVLVCDNLAFQGDLIALTRKHTTGLDLPAELTAAIARCVDHFDRYTTEVRNLRDTEMSDTRAKAVMHDAFVYRLLPLRLLPAVAQEYFRPSYTNFTERTAWSLYNAFTHVAKTLPDGPRFRALLELGRLFNRLCALVTLCPHA